MELSADRAVRCETMKAQYKRKPLDRLQDRWKPKGSQAQLRLKAKAKRHGLDWGTVAAKNTAALVESATAATIRRAYEDVRGRYSKAYEEQYVSLFPPTAAEKARIAGYSYTRVPMIEPHPGPGAEGEEGAVSLSEASLEEACKRLNETKARFATSLEQARKQIGLSDLPSLQRTADMIAEVEAIKIRRAAADAVAPDAPVVYRRHTDYMRGIWADRKALVDAIAAKLGHVDFDGIVVTGLSGAIIADRLAERLGKVFAVVRKPNDGSHSSSSIEGDLGRRWVFVDDFISSGSTFMRVCRTIKAQTDKSRCVGVISYQTHNGVKYQSIADAVITECGLDPAGIPGFTPVGQTAPLDLTPDVPF
jgi:orotate phosphoribosyltransferase-like protein